MAIPFVDSESCTFASLCRATRHLLQANMLVHLFACCFLSFMLCLLSLLEF